MKISVITGAAFPTGLAPTNRIIAYCKGLIEMGHSVEVICLYPTEKEGTVSNSCVQGVHEGISYLYASGTCIKPKLKLKVWFSKQKGLSNTFRHILLSHQDKPYNAILITTYSNTAIIMAKILSRLVKAPLVFEKGEYPKFIRRQQFFPISRWLCEFFIYRLFDGFLVITNALKDYFSKHARRGTPVSILPMCVDVDRFAPVQPRTQQKQIAYCGSLDNKKDGVNYLIDAFHTISSEYADWNLVIYGGSPSQVKIHKNKIDALGLEKKVKVTGWIENHRMPQLLLQASILVLPRPKSVQASGGFPTKLGEYLATGSPVITTSVGEIPLYLKDGQNAFITTPEDSKALAEKIKYVINNPETARQVGVKGLKLAQTVFHYKNISKQIVDFIQLLKHNVSSESYEYKI